jgi:uncharacterized protein (DUF1330 family)
MTGYVIVDIAGIHDEQMYTRYREQVSTGLTAAGGRYLVRGGAVEAFEGEWRPTRIVLARFDSSAAARNWWASQDHAALKAMRQASTTTNMIVAEGVAEEAKP